MARRSVVVAGGGPTGMMLAAELALRRSMSSSLNDARGGEGNADPGIRPNPLGHHDFPTRHNYGLALAQIQTELLLAAWVKELGVTTRRMSSS